MLLSSCVIGLTIDDASVIRCESTADCPAQLTCLADVGRCVDASSPCIGSEGEAVADGTSCADDGRICVVGQCVPGECGDGVVQPDAGEQCDPADNFLCHDDCRLPICGDDVVDPGESCDSDHPDCTSCIQRCSPGFTDEDLSVDNGCESTATVVYVPPGDDAPFPGGVVVGNDAYVGFLRGPLAEQMVAMRLPLDGSGAAQTLAIGLNASFARNSTDAFAHVLDDDAGSRVMRVTGGASETLFREPRGFGGIAADDEHVYAYGGGQIWVYTVAGVLEDALGVPFNFACRMMERCGDAIICTDFFSVAVVALDGSARLLHTRDGDFFVQTGCSASARTVILTATGVVEDDGAGQLRTLIATTPLSPISSVPGRTYTLDGDVLFFAEIGNYQTWRAERTTGALRAIATGFPVAFDERKLVMGADVLGQDARVVMVELP